MCQLENKEEGKDFILDSSDEFGHIFQEGTELISPSILDETQGSKARFLSQGCLSLFVSPDWNPRIVPHLSPSPDLIVSHFSAP